MSLSKSRRFDSDQLGGITGFFIGKILVAVAVMGLLCSTIALNSTLRRQTSDEELLLAAQAISGGLSCASGLPGEIELSKRLPEIDRDFKVTIVGAWENGLETIEIKVVSDREVKHSLVIECKVNGGDFTVSATNPRNMRLVKNRGTQEFSIFTLPLILLGFASTTNVEEISMELV